jgi:hypothetical protein
MKRRSYLILTVVGIGSLCVQEVSAENPYTPIVARNVFGLQPIPVAQNSGDEAAAAALPKITPNGIMTIFGKLQVIFKTATATPGQPPKELSYLMGEGERQDDIEVQKIDEKAATITFNNHGLIQTLELNKSGSGGAGASGGPGGGFRPSPANSFTPAGAAPGMGSRFGRNRNNSGGANPNPAPAPAPAPTAPATTPAAPNSSAPAAPALTPEEQVLMIEAQRAKAIQEGDPIANILPTTPHTKEVTGDGDESNGENNQQQQSGKK